MYKKILVNTTNCDESYKFSIDFNLKIKNEAEAQKLTF